jgi:hypothetical protein
MRDVVAENIDAAGLAHDSGGSAPDDDATTTHHHTKGLGSTMADQKTDRDVGPAAVRTVSQRPPHRNRLTRADGTKLAGHWWMVHEPMRGPAALTCFWISTD